MSRLRHTFVLAVLGLGVACSKGTDDQRQPSAPPASTSTTPPTSAPPASVPCSIAVPPLPDAAVDSRAFTSVLKTKRRIDVMGVDGRLLFAATSRAVTPHGPGTEYVNQLHELDGDTLRPVAGLQRGLWADFALRGAWGHWPATLSSGTWCCRRSRQPRRPRTW